MYGKILNEKDLPMDQLREIGLARGEEILLDRRDIHALLSGSRTNLIRLENISRAGVEIKEMDVKLSLSRDSLVHPDLLVHPVYKQAITPSFITSNEADQLLTGLKGNVVKSLERGGVYRDMLIEYDWNTREFVVTDTSKIQAPLEINGQPLTPYQKDRYLSGRQIEMPDGSMVQASGTAPEGFRSNRMALVVSILMDGGISYLLYQGLNALIDKQGETLQEKALGKAYSKALERFEKPEAGAYVQLVEKAESAQMISGKNEQQRSYGRSGFSR
ncbi:DUF4099 domain-containing protein [Pedobacter sp. GR22-10]|uniref:DUF4099 domain-containing protein n=1 Tax=Pedobacter sp. GR22-10 TaxID=2994472 RepID=UPI0022470572|nr:DUF4099 domain-containing protein [Pedobacter sp. GR22-10]MCX2429692.1 DUF4099 domain-containing protein [Pedobacter sp. GR22-10]